jgi:hypothetical protein
MISRITFALNNVSLLFHTHIVHRHNHVIIKHCYVRDPYLHEDQQARFGNWSVIIVVIYLAAVWSVAYGSLVALVYIDAATAVWVSHWQVDTVSWTSNSGIPNAILEMQCQPLDFATQLLTATTAGPSQEQMLRKVRKGHLKMNDQDGDRTQTLIALWFREAGHFCFTIQGTDQTTDWKARIWCLKM